MIHKVCYSVYQINSPVQCPLFISNLRLNLQGEMNVETFGEHVNVT